MGLNPAACKYYYPNRLQIVQFRFFFESCIQYVTCKMTDFVNFYLRVTVVNGSVKICL